MIDTGALKKILSVQTDEELKRALKYLQDFSDLAADKFVHQHHKDMHHKIATIMYWLRQQV